MFLVTEALKKESWHGRYRAIAVASGGVAIVAAVTAWFAHNDLNQAQAAQKRYTPISDAYHQGELNQHVRDQGNLLFDIELTAGASGLTSLAFILMAGRKCENYVQASTVTPVESV